MPCAGAGSWLCSLCSCSSCSRAEFRDLLITRRISAEGRLVASTEACSCAAAAPCCCVGAAGSATPGAGADAGDALSNRHPGLVEGSSRGGQAAPKASC